MRATGRPKSGQSVTSESTEGSNLRIRASLLEYRRDSYVVSARAFQDRPGAYPEAPEAPEASAGRSHHRLRLGVRPVRYGAGDRGRPPSHRPGDPLPLPGGRPRDAPEAGAPRALPGRGRHGADSSSSGHGSFNLMERVIHKFLRADEMLGVGPQFNEIPSEFEEAGGDYRSVPLDEAGYRLPVAALEEALASHPVSILYVDNPNNPLGRHFDPADLERLARSCERTGSGPPGRRGVGRLSPRRGVGDPPGRPPPERHRGPVVLEGAGPRGRAGRLHVHVRAAREVLPAGRHPVRAEHRRGHAREGRARRSGPARGDPPGGGPGQGEDRRGLRGGRPPASCRPIRASRSWPSRPRPGTSSKSSERSGSGSSRARASRGPTRGGTTASAGCGSSKGISLSPSAEESPRL